MCVLVWMDPALLNIPLAADMHCCYELLHPPGVQYVLELYIAAAGDEFVAGGDTNGDTDLLCLPSCATLPVGGFDSKSDDFQVVRSISGMARTTLTSPEAVYLQQSRLNHGHLA